MQPNTKFSDLITTTYKPVREQLKYLHPIHGLQRMPENTGLQGFAQSEDF